MPFKQTTGSRAMVMHGTAKKTTGGLTKKQLKYNKQGKIVSKKASAIAKKNNRLVKSGYITIKGQFGYKKIIGGSTITLDSDTISSIFADIKNKNPGNSLGSGSYGTITKGKNNTAIKKFTTNTNTNKKMSIFLDTRADINSYFIPNIWEDNKLVMTGIAISLFDFLFKIKDIIKDIKDQKNILYHILLDIYKMFYDLYNKKIYYTDLKPENILCVEKSDGIEIKFGDIGSCVPTYKMDDEDGRFNNIAFNMEEDFFKRSDKIPYIEWISSYGSITFKYGKIIYRQLTKEQIHDNILKELDSIFFIFIIDSLRLLQRNFCYDNDNKKSLLHRTNIWETEKKSKLIEYINNILSSEKIDEKIDKKIDLVLSDKDMYSELFGRQNLDKLIEYFKQYIEQYKE